MKPEPRMHTWVLVYATCQFCWGNKGLFNQCCGDKQTAIWRKEISVVVSHTISKYKSKIFDQSPTRVRRNEGMYWSFVSRKDTLQDNNYTGEYWLNHFIGAVAACIRSVQEEAGQQSSCVGEPLLALMSDGGRRASFLQGMASGKLTIPQRWACTWVPVSDTDGTQWITF